MTKGEAATVSFFSTILFWHVVFHLLCPCAFEMDLGSATVSKDHSFLGMVIFGLHAIFEAGFKVLFLGSIIHRTEEVCDCNWERIAQAAGLEIVTFVFLFFLLNKIFKEN